MIGLGDDGPFPLFEIARVHVRVLPEPVEAVLVLAAENGSEIALAAVPTGLVLPGPGEPSTWGAALISELAACAGIEPAGLDVRHLDRVLAGRRIRARLLQREGGETYLIAVGETSIRNTGTAPRNSRRSPTQDQRP
jgi:hypothetical protein